VRGKRKEGEELEEEELQNVAKKASPFRAGMN